MFETVTYELDGHVATVTLNRPEVLNAFNQRMLDEFLAIWRDVRLDDEVRVVLDLARDSPRFHE